MKLAICPWVYGNVIVDPDDVVDHPLKAKPVRVGEVGAVEMVPPTSVDPAVTALPPWEL